MSLPKKIIIGIVIIIVLFIGYIVLDANKYSAQVLVIDGEGKVGVNPTTESLDFGDLSRGTSAVRRVNLVNGTGASLSVMVWKLGGISSLMEIDDALFRLDPHTERKISFTTYIPASAGVGERYTGRVFIFKVPTFGL